MRFTEENIKKYDIMLTENGNFRSNKYKVTYCYHYACEECGYPHLNCSKNSKWCSGSCAKTGKDNPFKRPGFGERMTGEKNPAKRIEVRNKLSKKMLNRSPEVRINQGKTLKALGENHPSRRPEFRKRMSGENNPNWKGGIACEPYCTQWTDKEYKDWIRMERDGKCFGVDCDGQSKRLCLHHINYNKKDCRPTNLITLCVSCNSKANTNREWHQAWYTEIMSRRGLNVKVY
jgi:hypothetical protein